MRDNFLKIFIVAFLISGFGVFVVDFLSHLLFSDPMETFGYFVVKMVFYFIFSVLFLSFSDLAKKEFLKVAIAGVAVSSLWGMYYNVFPMLFDYYPVGISLRGLTFLGMGSLGTGMAFGIVHILAFVSGYYFAKYVLQIDKA